MFTYDVLTPVGQVRLLSIDVDQSTAIFQDEEIQALLNLNNGEVRLAAAQALDVIASSESYISKKMMVDGDQFDGPAVATALHAQATELREQAFAGVGSNVSPIDWAEMVTDPFGYRDRLVAEMLRLSS